MMLPSPTPRPRPQLLAGASVALLALLWCYWPLLGEMSFRWAHDPQYSHGYLVPLFAGFLLWLRRDRLRPEAFGPSWWGLAVVGLALGIHLAATYLHYLPLGGYSIVPCVAGLVLALGGWAALRWAWPAVLFLLFMIPLPYALATSLSAPLQALATTCSTFVLQAIGLPAVAEGNVIHINDAHIGIVEACNGLRMLFVFFALSTGMALVVKAPLFDRLFLVVSSVPIALVSNILRITITGALEELVNNHVADVFFHDVAGWLMMPLALGMLWLELKILSHLLVESAHVARPRVRERKQRPTPAPLVVAAPRRPRPARPCATARPKEAAEVPTIRPPRAARRPAVPPPPAPPQAEPV